MGSKASSDSRYAGKTKVPRALGTLFDDLTIDRAAYLTVRAAACWGGRATLAIDADNRATVYCPETRDELALWKRAPDDIVGVFTGSWNGKTDMRIKAQERIGDDIVSHLEGRMGARKAA